LAIEIEANTILLGVITITTGIAIPLFVRIYSKLDDLCNRLSNLEGRFEETH